MTPLWPVVDDIPDEPIEQEEEWFGNTSEVCAACGVLLDEFELGTSFCDDCAEKAEMKL